MYVSQFDLKAAIKRRNDTIDMIDRLEESRHKIADKTRNQAKYNYHNILLILSNYHLQLVLSMYYLCP